MLKRIIIALLAALLFITPMAVVTVAALSSPGQYDQTFLGELRDKHRRLASIKEEKLVLIGGSNLAFGLDSAQLEEYVGMPVVNYGLYATIGTKAMLDLSRPHVHKGDVVVICPETDKQTYSLYYNAHSMWQALDGDLTMLRDVGFSNWGKLLAGIPAFAAEKREFLRTAMPAPTGIYAEASFNEYGDVAVERPYNEMPADYDLSMPVSLTTALLEDAFVDYLNDYAAHCRARGATVYFGFSPINGAAVTSTEEEKEAFYAALQQRLDFPVLSDVDDYIMNPAFFYDTNFHLNSVGAQQRTALLAADLLRVHMGNPSWEMPVYTPPQRPADYFADADTDADTPDGDNTPGADHATNFLFEEVKEGYAIVGLSEAGKQQETLTIPAENEGKPVVIIGDNAFAGSAVLTRVIIGENAKVKSFTEGALSNCPTLRALEIHLPPAALPIHPQAVAAMPAECLIYIPAQRFGDFATDYFWCSMMHVVETLPE